MKDFGVFLCHSQLIVVFLGSYDHTVKLFDARLDKSVMTMNHGQPVESLLLYPSEGLLVSAGTQQYVPEQGFSWIYSGWNWLLCRTESVELSHEHKIWCDVVKDFHYQKQINPDSLTVIFFRGTLRESVGFAKRRAASCVSEEPSQNCHLFVSEQQWTETAVGFSGQVQGHV